MAAETEAAPEQTTTGNGTDVLGVIDANIQALAIVLLKCKTPDEVVDVVQVMADLGGARRAFLDTL